MYLRLVASLYGFKPQVFYLVTPTAPSIAAYTRYLVKNTEKALNKIWNLFCRNVTDHLQHEMMDMTGKRTLPFKPDKIDDKLETLCCLN